MTFEPRTDRANDVAEAGRPEGDNTIRVLASVVTRLILQQHRARAGNAEAVAALQGFRDSLAAQNVHVAADTGLEIWVSSLLQQHMGREAPEEHLAHHTGIALTWAPLLPRWADEQLILACDHLRTISAIPGRCHGCLQIRQRWLRQCTTCMVVLCQECRPLVEGEI